MQKHGLTLLLLHTNLYKKTEIIRKMRLEDVYIPASCRTNFSLQIMKDTEARDPQKALDLRDQAVAAKTAYEATMKAIVIATAEEDSKTLQEQILDAAIKAIKDLSHINKVADEIRCNTHLRVASVLYHHGIDILSGTTQDATAFKTRYAALCGLDNFPLADNPPVPHDDMDDQERAQVMQAHAEWSASPINRNLQELADLLEDTLARPYQAFQAQHLKNQRDLALTKASRALIVTNATDETAMAIDQEVPADQQQLRDIIAKAVDKRTASLTAQLSRLEMRIPKSQQKSQQRGQQPGASIKKKSNNSSTPGLPSGANRSNGGRGGNHGNTRGGRSAAGRGRGNRGGRGASNKRNSNSTGTTNPRNGSSRRGTPGS